MAEYNPSKIIKDGNTYNFRDTTKIPLAGSNEISGSLVPSTDGTVDLGSSTAQWKSVYTQTYYYNGTAWGLDKANTWTDTNTFSKTNSDTIQLKNGRVAIGETISSDTFTQFSFKDKNTDNLAYIRNNYIANGTNNLDIYVRNKFSNESPSTTGSVVYTYFGLSLDNTGKSYARLKGDFYPYKNNLYSLGTSTNKWSKIYSDDIVHTTGNETVSGVKTFSDGLFVSKSEQGDLATLEDSSINSTNEDTNGMPLTGHTNSIKIKGSQSNVVPCMLTGIVHTNGNTEAKLYAYKYKDLTANASLSLRYNYNSNYGTVTFDNINAIIPSITNTTNLGVSALQWNKIYARNILIDNDINIASSLINKTSNSGMLSIRSGLTNQDGASIALYSKDYSGGSNFVGNIYMTAYGNSDYTIFRIYPNGAMSVYNNSTATTKVVAMQEDVVPRSGGAVMTGDLLASPTTNSIGFGYGWGNGGTIYTYSPTNSTVGWQGAIRLEPLKTTSDFKTMQIYPSGTWTWNGTACQITSDQRYKQQITEIDDKLLDAWEDVELVQFKYNESVDTKGKSARLHTGYVVQQIDSACKSHNVDISEYGLYCHEEYPEETKEVEVEQKDGTKTKERKVIRKASEHYSLRYTEALIVECKYLRRCIARLTARIEELEKGNNIK